MEESMIRSFKGILLTVLLAGSVLAADAPPHFAAPVGGLSPEARRGEHLVVIGGCHDCHTPKKPGPSGPVPDMSHMLSGHPEQLQIPVSPALPAPWVLAAAGSMTAFAGPWGTTFAANLTPDRETGLGDWTEQDFVEAIRRGHHRGRGRPILPPMPWAQVAQHTDSELKAIWAYLRSIPPVRNQVPDPRPPAGAPSGSGG
jgi:hypothetical protein